MIKTYFLLFILYSFFGWIIETIATFVDNHKFVNRGFLMGPYCPIYGCGCLLLTILLGRYSNEPFALFALAIIICSLLEYFTSWIMEIIFKMRWWDYTDKKFNINGRICLETMIPFGLLGVFVVKYLNPFLLSMVNKIPNNILDILFTILGACFIIDIIISSNVIFNLKLVVKNIRQDSTEEIKKQVKKQIQYNKALYNRLVNAFPNLQKIVKNRKKKLKKIKKKKR